MTRVDVGCRGRDAMEREPSRTRRWSALLLCCLLTMLVGCASVVRTGTLTARVVDAQTGQPIAGAVVLAVWTKVGGLPGLSHTKLVDVRETETDAGGQFVLERPRGVSVDEESITVYKFGHIAWNNLREFPSWKSRETTSVPRRVLLEKFPAGISHQRHLSFMNSARAAGMYGHESIPRFSAAIRRELDMP